MPGVWIAEGLLLGIGLGFMWMTVGLLWIWFTYGSKWVKMYQDSPHLFCAHIPEEDRPMFMGMLWRLNVLRYALFAGWGLWLRSLM